MDIRVSGDRVGRAVIVATVLLFLAPQAHAGNGGNVYAAPKSKLELNREDAAKRAEAARKKTDKLNKEWKAKQRKEARAKAKAKAKAEREAAKEIKRKKKEGKNELKEVPGE